MPHIARTLASFSLVLFLLTASATPAAAQYTWSTTPTTANWNLAGNWSGGLPASGINTTMTFGATNTTTLNDDLAALFQLNSLSFTASAPAYTISGNSLDFRTNGSSTSPAVAMATNNAVTINNLLTLTNNFAVTGVGTGTLTLNGNISGPGGFTQSFAGTTILNGTNTYSGTTTVSQGTLIVNGSTASGSAVTVAGGATLGGGGTVAGPVAANGTIAPGVGLTVGNYATLRTGAVTFSGTGSLVENLGAVGGDSLVVNGTANLAGTLTVNATNPDQSVYTLLSATSITGAFTTLPTIPSGYGVQVTPTQIALGKLVLTAPSLTASDATNGDQFGFSVSQSGTRGLVGAYNKNFAQGAAYLFRGLDTATGTVTQNVKLTASDGAANDRFGYSVSQSGTIALIGADQKNSNQGAAYLFRGLDTTTGTVTQNVKLTASDAAASDNFGYSVSLSGTIGMVGAYGKNSAQGAAYLFRGLDTASGTVTQNVKLTASDATNGDQFGYSVSQSGTIGLVGAIANNSAQGAAYLFRGLDTATGTIMQNVKLTASDATSVGQLGRSVSLSGTIGLVGAPIKNSQQGAAYLFRGLDTATGTVTQNVKLTASDGAALDEFGWSLSLSGSIGLIGAHGKNSGQGAAYLFRGLDTATGAIIQNVKLTASDGVANDVFGHSVNLSGDQFTIGAFGKNSQSGKAYTGTVSSVTTLDFGGATRTIDGVSFASQDDWVVGQNTSGNRVTLNAGNAANVTAVGKAVYVGQNAGSNNNTLIVAGTLTANQITIGASGNSGNVLQLGNGGTTGTLSIGSVITNNGTLVFNRSNTITQGTDFGSAAITGTGGVTQAGPGTTIFNAANTYTGGTSISGGTLRVNNTTGSATGTGAVSVASFATLAGGGTSVGSSGIVSGPVTVQIDGHVAPGSGSSSGVLNLNGGVTFNLGSNADIKLNSSTLGSGYDRISVTGTANLDSSLNLTLGTGFTPNNSDVFTILTAGAVSGTFSNTPSNHYTISNVGIFDVNYGTTTVVLTNFTPVPEPGTILAIGAGVLGLGCYLRRRRAVVSASCEGLPSS